MKSAQANAPSKGTCAVIGGGLVGALEACHMAKNGYQVHLYEYRKDIRELEHVPGRSINLAMSHRGITAMNDVGLGSHIAEEYGIPMRARMIHNTDGTCYEVPYGKHGQCIYSVGRRYINEFLLTAGEKFPNLHYHFEHKLIDLDVDKAKMKFQHRDQEVDAEVDFVLGCDGAFSTVRKHLSRMLDFNFSQTYIPHRYKELCMDPTEDGKFAMPENFLHIWPRGQFMMIALPNRDKTFTLTLFMPNEKFESLTSPSELLTFFETYFPDSLPLIGREKIVKDYFSSKPSPLVSIKCKPYNWKDKVLILGDAAHAMVPFYGQGMNCGMEDVVVLDTMLDEHPTDRLKAFNEYSKYRNPDAEAICDLAMYNYVEMRDLVSKPSFLLRKKLDNLLHFVLPSKWIPLYTSVTFTRMRYHQCIENKKWQDELLSLWLSRLYYCSLLGTAYLFVNRARSCSASPEWALSSLLAHTRAVLRLQ